MRGIFNYDGPVMSFLGRIADLIWLNVLIIFFSLPIITIGAAQTAGHYAALKLKREEGHVLGNFWKSFKMNFKQSTLIWLILVVLYVVNVFAIMVSNSSGMPMASLISGVLLAALIFIGLMNLWIYPLQCRFSNKISVTFRNAFFMSFRYIFRSILMAIAYAVPVAIILAGLYQVIPILLLLGISLPIYWNVLAYNKVFEKIEEQIMGVNEEVTEEKEEGEDNDIQPQLPDSEA